jgi:hypothetical protein
LRKFFYSSLERDEKKQWSNDEGRNLGKEVQDA